MIRTLVLLLLLALSQTANAGLQIEQPPRSFGYFIGDILLQRINLDSHTSAIQDPNFSSVQRVGQYLYRLPSVQRLQNEQRWLELRYQIINSPPIAKTISLPVVSLQTIDGDELQIEPWPFNVSPLSTGEETEEILPDRSALTVTDRYSNFSFLFSLSALLLTLSLWLIWWVFRYFNDSRTLPFAKARRVIMRLPKAQRDAEPKAWIALHHAFNSVAGKTVSANSLLELFHTAPWLEPFQETIENFYAASAARFFQQSDTPPVVAVEALCEALYRQEKRQKPGVRHTGVAT